jgi:CRISPR/Cas system-associated exonuclease Cas4 (RecB family)
MYYYQNVMGLGIIAEAGEDRRSHAEPDDADEYSCDADLPKGIDRKLLGVFVHQFLYEWMSQDAAKRCSIETLLEHLSNRYGFTGSQKKWVMAVVTDSIHAFASSPLGAKTENQWLERPFRLRLDRLLFRGVLDRVDRCDKGFRIVDYKGAAERNEHQFQVKFYAWAVGNLGMSNVNEGVLCYLRVPTKLVSVDVSPREIEAIEHHAGELESATAAGRFEPRPGEACGTCSFALVCPSFENTGHVNP